MTEENIDQGSGWGSILGSARDALTVIFKRRLIILSIFLTTLALVSIWMLFWVVPVYEAYSSLLIKFGRENIYRPEVGNQKPAVAFDRAAALLSEINIMTSHDLAEKVLTAMEVEKVYPRPEGSAITDENFLHSAATTFKANLSVDQVVGSNVIEIFFKHPNPEIAAKAVNLLVDHLKEKHLKIFSDPNTPFLEEQLESYRKQLKMSESRLNMFKQKNGVTAAADQKRLLLKQRNDLDTSLKTAQNHLEGLNGKVDSLKNQLTNIPNRIPLSSTTQRQGILERAKADLLALQRKESSILAKYTENSRPVINIRKEIVLVEKFIKQEHENTSSDKVITGKNPIYQKLEMDLLSAETELDTVQARKSVIKNQIDALDEKLHQFDGVVQKFQVIQAEVDLAREHHQTYQKKVEEARVSAEMDLRKMSNISVIQPAVVPQQPVGTSSILKILLGAIVGGLAGIVVAFFLEHIRGQYSTPEQVTRDVNLPVLAWIPYKS